MPPKKVQEKQKQKIIEDKTFGMKNKKGAKGQKIVEQITKQVQNKGQNLRRDLLSPEEERAKRKEEEKKKKEELSMLFKPVITQTVAKGVDPKSVVCAFFKQGLCQKGDKCKFSHDLTLERKAEKRSIYDDAREDNDSMANWDEQKLEDVINTKHGEDNKQKNTTQIVCKFFIEAVENKTYGWFWACPNEKEGSKCMYRHALPPGFTLKSDQKKLDEQKEEIALETLVEKERAALGSTVTKITLESFLAWKARKIQEKKDKAKEQEEKKKKDFKLGFMNGLTGKDLFTFNPDLIANDDDDANNDIDYRHRDSDDEEEGTGKVSVREIDANYFATQAKEVDDSGTVATSDRFDYIKSIIDREKAQAVAPKLNQADGGVEDVEEDGEEDGEVAGAVGGAKKNLDIDESLFTMDDLGDIQDELEDLEIS